MKDDGLVMAIQTFFPLKAGESFTFPKTNSNVYMVLNELISRGIESLVVPSEGMRIENGEPIAQAYVLKGDPAAHRHNTSFFVAGVKDIPVNDLDALFIRGDDIEKNPALDDLFPLVDKSSVYIPVDYWEMKATKDKLDTAHRFADLNIPKTMYAEDKLALQSHIEDLFGDGHRFVVLKYRFGFGGKDVARLDREAPDYLKKANDFLDAYKQVIVQEYDPSVQENDIRAVTYDGKFIGSFERSGDTRWPTSVSSGGTPLPHEPLPGEIDACEAIAARFPGIKLLGIDLFKSLRLIENNGYCGSIYSLDSLYGINLAKPLVEDAVAYANNK